MISFRNTLLSVSVLPLALTQPYFFNFKGQPDISVDENTIRLKTRAAAGGVAYLLPRPLPLETPGLRVSWKWAVKKFPQTAVKLPLTRATDDFAARVGLLVDDGSVGVKVPPHLANELERRGLKLSRVVFYCASPRGTRQTCETSPYHSSVKNCLKEASEKVSDMEVAPLREVEKKSRTDRIIGVWFFADSDNAGTASAASVSEVRFTSD